MLTTVKRWVSNALGGHNSRPSRRMASILNLRVPEHVLPIVGLDRHGKTAFIWSALGTLRQLGLVWPGWETRTPADMDDPLEAQRESALDGKLPDPSPGGLDSHTLRLLGMPSWGNRTLTLRHQRLEELETTLAPLPAPSHAPVTLLLADVSQFEEEGGEHLQSLFDRFLATQDRLGRLRRHGGLVLVLTRADRLLLNESARAYLVQDPLAGLWPNLAEADQGGGGELGSAKPAVPAIGPYVDGLYKQDKRLQEWLGRSMTGAALLEQARASRVNLRVAAVSATGSDADCRELVLPWRAHRVLDPIFWAFELESS